MTQGDGPGPPPTPPALGGLAVEDPSMADAGALTRESNLAGALIAASKLPVLLFDDQLRVTSVSRSFCTAFAVDAVSLVGRTLDEIGDGWDMLELRQMLERILAG